jgi:DNA-binding IclR family transcriptional regulator
MMASHFEIQSTPGVDPKNKTEKKWVNNLSIPGNLQSLDRALLLLRVAAHSNSGMRLTDLTKVSGLSKSTVHRLLSALVSHGLLKLSTQTRKYTPGIDLYQLGRVAGRHFSIIDIARPALERLAIETEDTIYLSVIDGSEAVCADRIIGSYPIKTLTLAPGHRRPLGVGAGALALLAALNDKEMVAFVNDDSQRRPEYSQFSAPVLQNLVNETRKEGFSYNNDHVFNGMSAVGVAILDFNGYPLGAISVAAISSRMTPARHLNIVEQMKKESAHIAMLISQHIGSSS